MNLSHIYFYSDLDGTLGTMAEGIPYRNIEAIRRYVSRGGNFGVATGRWVSEIPKFLQDIPVNLPCIVNNGSSICDFKSKTFLKHRILPKTAGCYLKEILEDYPKMDLLAVNQDGCFYCPRPSQPPLFPEETRHHLSAELESLNEPFVKFLFLTEIKNIHQTISDLRQRNYPGIQFTQSSANGFEMVLASNNKGAALLEVCDSLQIPMGNTVFIGDSYNDSEMFQTAGFSACISSTPKELQPLCNLVMGDCKGGAVADLIEMLEKPTIVPLILHKRKQHDKIFNSRPVRHLNEPA